MMRVLFYDLNNNLVVADVESVVAFKESPNSYVEFYLDGNTYTFRQLTQTNPVDLLYAPVINLTDGFERVVEIGNENKESNADFMNPPVTDEQPVAVPVTPPTMNDRPIVVPVRVPNVGVMFQPVNPSPAVSCWRVSGKTPVRCVAVRMNKRPLF